MARVKRKKFILFSYSSIPSYTANSIAVMNFCNELNKICDLTVVCIKNKKIDESYINFYKVEKMNLILLPKFFLKFHYLFFKIFALIICLLKGPDIIFSRDIVISYFLTRFKKRNVFELHQIKQNGNNYYTKNFERMLKYIVSKKQLKHLVVISDSLKKDCIDYGINSQKIIVANSGVRNDFFKLKLSNNKNILYLGSLQKGKGINNIIKLANKLRNYNFFIIGGYKSEIDKQIPNNIIHKPWVRPSEVLKNVDNIDYALMLFDNQDYKFYSPLKLFEYMAMGKIVFASNIIGINDIVIDGYNGFLVNPNDINLLIEKIIMISKNDKLKEYISNNAKKTAKKYTWEKRAKYLLEVFNDDR